MTMQTWKWLKSALRTKKQNGTGRTIQKKKRSLNLLVEALEDRLTPVVGASLNAGVLTVTLSAANDHAFLRVDAGNSIDVGTSDGGNQVADNQAPVTSIVVVDTSPGSSAPGQAVTFSATGGTFTQNISLNNIEIANVRELITGSVTGNATTILVDDPGQIQDGVDFAATTGATVNVAAGTFNETVTVGKSLTLQGAQVNVDARSRGFVPANETIVSNVNGAFSLQADNITLNGFTIQGQTAVGLGAGIATSAAASGYQIRNNIIQDNTIGINLLSDGDNQTIVDQNWILDNNNAGPAGGTGIYSDAGLSNTFIQNNRFSGDNFNLAINLIGSTGVATDITVANNAFQNGNNMQLLNVDNSTILGNQFSGVKLDPNNEGNAIFLGGGNDNVTIEGNSFTNRAWGVLRSVNIGFGLNTNISILENQISQNFNTLAFFAPPDNLQAMIRLSDLAGTTIVDGNTAFFSGAVSGPPLTNNTGVNAIQVEGNVGDVEITANELYGNNFDTAAGPNPSAAIRLINTLAATANILIERNYLNGFVNAVRSDSLAATVNVDVNHNHLAGNSGPAIVNGAGAAATIDANANWWGTTSIAAINAAFQGNVNVTTFLNSGADMFPGKVGFQPDLNGLRKITPINNNQAPVFSPSPSNQNRFRNQGEFTITVNATDANGDAISYNAYLVAELAFQLDQQLQLNVHPRGFFTNALGQGEKWLTGVTNEFGNPWYIIFPDGRFLAWDGSSQATGRVLANLTPAYHANPALLFNAPPPPPVEVKIVGNEVRINPGSFVGSFEVVVQAADGQAVTVASFLVTISNRPPTITPTPDQTMSSNQDKLFVPIQASDPDGDALTYFAVAGHLGYVLDQVHNLSFAGSFFQNYGGQQERWLAGSVNQFGNVWYFIKPNGQFWAWDGQVNQATGALIDTLDPIFYHRPEMLYDAIPQDLAFAIDQTLDLHFGGSFYQNYGGQQEKWIRGTTNRFGNPWYFIKPNGEFYAWDGTLDAASGDLLATLDTDYYFNPNRLFNAPANQVFASASGNIVTVDPAPGFEGSFYVLVTVSDGLATARDYFRVNVV